MFPSHPIFKKYKNLWEKMFGLVESELTGDNLKTWMGNKNNLPKENAPYDYIFATKDFELIHTETIDYRKELDTDHQGMVARLVLTKSEKQKV